MAQEKSLADQLVFFMRVRDETSAKIEAMSHDSDAWVQFGMMLEEQNKAVRDALFQAAMNADRLGRMATTMQDEQA